MMHFKANFIMLLRFQIRLDQIRLSFRDFLGPQPFLNHSLRSQFSIAVLQNLYQGKLKTVFFLFFNFNIFFAQIIRQNANTCLTLLFEKCYIFYTLQYKFSDQDAHLYKQKFRKKMNLQKTQLFQRKRWNPSQSNATTLPNIHRKSLKRQLESPVSSQSRLTVIQPTTNEFHNRTTNNTRPTSIKSVSKWEIRNQKSSAQNPLNHRPTKDSNVSQTSTRHYHAQSRQITTPISSLINIGSSLENKRRVQGYNRAESQGLKFKVSVNETASGEIKGYFIEEEPEQLRQLRDKERMLDIYIIEMKDKMMSYKQKINCLEKEKQQLTEQKATVTKGCDQKHLKRLQLTKQKLKKKEQEIAKTSQSQINTTWILRDQYFDLYEIYRQMIDKLPQRIKKVVDSKQFAWIEERLVEVDKMMEAERQSMNNLEGDIWRIQKEIRHINKQRTAVLLELAASY